jgi:hypothetical protein
VESATRSPRPAAIGRGLRVLHDALPVDETASDQDLVAGRLGDAQIAERLFLSVHTVHRHVSPERAPGHPRSRTSYRRCSWTVPLATFVPDEARQTGAFARRQACVARGRTAPLGGYGLESCGRRAHCPRGTGGARDAALWRTPLRARFSSRVVVRHSERRHGLRPGWEVGPSSTSDAATYGFVQARSRCAEVDPRPAAAGLSSPQPMTINNQRSTAQDHAATRGIEIRSKHGRYRRFGRYPPGCWRAAMAAVPAPARRTAGSS